MEVFDTSIVEQIEMKMIRPSNFAVRDKFQESLEMESLMLSIKEHGLLQPILIRPKLNGSEIAQDTGDFMHANLFAGDT